MVVIVTKKQLEEAQNAAKRIEMDGAEALNSVAQRCGQAVALALVVAHVRRSLGSGDTFPPRASINAQVEALLTECGAVTVID